MKQRPHKD